MISIIDSHDSMTCHFGVEILIPFFFLKFLKNMLLYRVGEEGKQQAIHVEKEKNKFLKISFFLANEWNSPTGRSSKFV